MAKVTGTKVITNKVRLSYAYLLESKSINNQEAKYSTTLLIPKSDKATLQAIEQAIDNAYAEDGGKKLKGVKRERVKTTLRDGDNDDKVDPEENPEYKGMMFMNVSSKTKPGLVDRYKNKIEGDSAADVVYSGVYAIVSINFFAYNSSGNKGISAGLNNVMIVEKGEPLAGRASAESDFADIEFDDDDFEEDLI